MSAAQGPPRLTNIDTRKCAIFSENYLGKKGRNWPQMLHSRMLSSNGSLLTFSIILIGNSVYLSITGIQVRF